MRVSAPWPLETECVGLVSRDGCVVRDKELESNLLVLADFKSEDVHYRLRRVHCDRLYLSRAPFHGDGRLVVPRETQTAIPCGNHDSGPLSLFNWLG